MSGPEPHGDDGLCYCSVCGKYSDRAAIRLEMLREVRECMRLWRGDIDELFDRMIAEEEAKS